MRFRLPLLAFAALLAPITAMTLISACGNTSDNTIADAANDNTTVKDQTVDVAPDVAVDAGCDAPQLSDGGLNGLLPDGGGGFGPCINCFGTQCGSQISACNADCSCREVVIQTITCIQQTGNFQTCGQTALLTGDTQVTDLLGCAYNKCLSICTGDGGGSDAAKDAPADGG